MAGFEKFAAFIKKKVSDKKKREKREKDPSSTWSGASDSEKKRYKILDKANKRKQEKKNKEKEFYSKYGLK